MMQAEKKYRAQGDRSCVQRVCDGKEEGLGR